MSHLLPPPLADLFDPVEHPDSAPIRAWAAHLDAGRLGGNLPMPDAVRAILEANDALFRARTRRVRSREGRA